MNAPRRSFLLSIAITFVLGYGLADLGHFIFTNFQFYEDFNKQRTLNAVDELKLGALLLRYNEVDELTRHLEDANTSQKIDFFLIQDNGQTIASGNVSDDLRKQTFVPNRIVMNDRETYGSVQVGTHLLVVGVHKRIGKYIQSTIDHNRTDIGLDIVLISIMVMGIVLFFFRDIRALIEVIRNRDRKGLAQLRPGATTEAVVMARGLKAYESQLQGLRHDRVRLSNQVHPSLRTELDSGLEPPYQFRCIMVRTDINHYSTIYSKYPVEEFMEVINEFFSRSSVIIDRYRGYVTDYVGDEIIYYFKEDEHENAAAIALAAIRDVNAIAEELHRRTEAENGYPFRVKSAVACGSLRFGKQVNGFALSGGVFVETVRILSQVDEKEHNSVYLPNRLALRVSPACQTEPRKSIELKGIPGVTQLYTVSEFRDSARILSDLTESNSPELQLFRSDTDLLRIFAKMQELCQSPRGIALSFKAIQALRLMAAPSAAPAVRDGYCAYLSEVMRHCFDSPDTEARRLFSAAVTLSVKIVAREAYDETLRGLLARCLSSPDRRVLSNGIDAFTHFEPAESYGMLSRLIRHPDNRVMANALIKQGLISLDEKVIAALRSMITSRDPLYQASGAYAVGEIAHFYRSEDLTFFETHLSFRALLGEVARLTPHPDPMVRRQAEAAIAKAQIEATDWNIVRKAA